MSRIEHPIGHFCWAELGVPDAAAAHDFYSGLLNWTSRVDTMPSGLPYTTFFYEGLEAAACYQLTPQMLAQGARPHWLPYVIVADVEASGSKVKELGGKVHLEPREAGPHGRLSVVADPTGAVLALWQAKAHRGSHNGHVNGRHCWTELMSTDVAAARDFYTALFGWSFHTGDMGGVAYTSWLLDGQPVGGMMPVLPHMQGVPSHWSVYFSVPSLAAALEYAGARGASTCVPPMEVPGVGTMAGLADPQGAVVYLIELKSA